MSNDTVMPNVRPNKLMSELVLLRKKRLKEMSIQFLIIADDLKTLKLNSSNEIGIHQLG